MQKQLTIELLVFGADFVTMKNGVEALCGIQYTYWWGCTKLFPQTRDAAWWEEEEECADSIW